MKLMRKRERERDVSQCVVLYNTTRENPISCTNKPHPPLYRQSKDAKSRDTNSWAIDWIEPTTGHTLIVLSLTQYF